MKAKFIAANNSFEMRLENGTIIASTEGEKKVAFLKRAKAEAAKIDETPLEIADLTAADFANLDLAKLKVTKTKQTGLLVVLLEEAIKTKEDANLKAEAAAKKVKDEAAAAKNAEKETAKKAKDEATAKAKAEKEAIVKTPKMTVEEAIALTEASQVNVGKTVEFLPHRTAIKTSGVIRIAWVDKRIPMVYYRIYDADNKMYNKAVNDPKITIGELAPNPKAEAAAAKIAEKEAAAKAKEEAKVKAAEEKAAAKIAKDEAIAKAKEEKAATLKANTEAIAAAKAEAIEKAKAEKATTEVVVEAPATDAIIVE